MAFITSGGSNVASAQIIDGSIVNADVNAAAAIAQSKLAGIAGAAGDLLAVEHTAGATHSLVTTGNEIVVVFAKGAFTGDSNEQTVTLAYNAVAKDTTNIRLAASGNKGNFIVMYTERPAAGTQNVTVAVGAGTLSDVDIIVLKFKAVPV